MNTAGRILIGIQNGKVATEIRFGKITQAEISMLITTLDLIKDNLKIKFRRGVKTQ